MAAALVEHDSDISTTMLTDRPKERKRKWHSKVTTGCSLCRQRRVKCDERKPGCLGCYKMGRECPGYEEPRTWLFESSRVPSSTSSHHSSQSLKLQLSPEPSISPFAQKEGFRSFQYYFEVSEPTISRFFGAQMAPLFDNRQGIESAINAAEVFWKIQFPRLVCAVPVIQSCLLLMTTAHEHVQKATYAFRQDPSCISKYGAAVTQLREEYSQLSIDCILLGSLLLAMGELAYGPSTSGLVHLCSAFQIIEQRQHNPSAFDKHNKPEEIEGLGGAVDLLVKAFFRKASRENYLPSSKIRAALNGADAAHVTIDLPFSTLQQVIGSLEEIKHSAIHVRRTRCQRNESKAVALQSNAASWMNAFEDFVCQPRRFYAWGFEVACLVVRIHGCIALVLSELPNNESDFDSHISLFRKIADTSERLFEQTQGRFSDAIKEQLVYGMGLINPLFFAATKCRDYALRRRLLGLLRLLSMAEGPWTSCTAYQIASRLASIEEDGMVGLSTTQIVPWMKRSRLVSAHLEDTFNVTMVYVLCGCVGSQYEETRTQTFKIVLCEHQTRIPVDVGTITEYGGSEGYVRESDCRCVKDCNVLKKDFDATIWHPPQS